MHHCLNIVAALSAFAAAIFWFLSAYGKLPPIIPYCDAVPEHDPFYRAIKFSARMNRCAAGLSGGSDANARHEGSGANVVRGRLCLTS
jgi:hypothetical protein